MTLDCYPVTASRILWASKGSRCSFRPNPKRPTWRCKLPPTWILMRTDVENMGAVYCDEHKVAATTGCPEPPMTVTVDLEGTPTLVGWEK